MSVSIISVVGVEPAFDFSSHLWHIGGLMKKELSISLFLLGLLLVNAPFLKIFDGVFLYYLFFVWGLLIFILGLMVFRASRDKSE